MKYFKGLAFTIFILLVFQCASHKQFENTPPTLFEDVYFQAWNSGIKEGGSGINLYIKTRGNTVAFDSVYFRGKATKLSANPKNEFLHIGRFKFNNNNSHNAIGISTIPFKLKADEAVVSYLKNRQVYYYKIENIAERETINYPSAKPIRQK
jgi:hypothetical protein